MAIGLNGVRVGLIIIQVTYEIGQTRSRLEKIVILMIKLLHFCTP